MNPMYENAVAQKPQTKNPVADLKNMVNSVGMQARFKEVMGDKAPAFLASVVSAVSTNPKLQEADPTSVLGSAMVAATLNLPIVPSLGQSAIVPYKSKWKDDRGEWHEDKKAQFQIMTKGLIQLAQRTGQYKNINSGEVYEDEFDGEDLLTGEVKFHRVHGGFRDQGREDKIIGYFAYIETVTGFKKTEFWNIDAIYNHAKKFSKTAYTDARTGAVSFYKNTPWADNFGAMARKTVLKSLINHYGPMSVDTQLAQALQKDQLVFDKTGEGSYEDNPLTFTNGYENAEIEEKGTPAIEQSAEAAPSEPQTVNSEEGTPSFNFG